MQRSMPLLCLPLLTCQASAADRIQSPDASWRTLPTVHYRIYFPDHPAFRPFALEVASKIEGIHSLLEKEVGFAFPGPTDVILKNPEATSNGMVVPRLERPTITLWTEPVQSDTEISHGAHGVDVLLLHELVHLHHLTYPDQKPRFLERLSAGPRLTRVAQRSPRWITEGYATYLEGRLTGIGRPHSAYRSLVLRQLAREGELPSYANLNGMSANLSSGIRYQVGSAFMEWLVERHPKRHGLWPDLWKRLASRRYGNFDSAFKATFGDMPYVLYGRYRAELTHTALELERRLEAAGLREGELWSQSPEGFLRHLSVSPDGAGLLAQASSGNPHYIGLQVYLLEDEDKKAKNEKEAREKQRAQGEDLPEAAKALRRFRAPIYSFTSDQFARPRKPLWEEDGTIRFEVTRQNSEGVGFRTSGTWKPRSFKPTRAVIQHVHPSWSPQGWMIRLGNKDFHLPFEPFGAVAHDTVRQVIYAATPVEGIFNLVRIPFDGSAFGPMEILTRTAAGALYPAPTPDGKHVFYIQPSGHGSQIRRLDLTQDSLPITAVSLEPTPFVKEAVLPRPDDPSRLPPPEPVPADRSYAVRDSHLTGVRFGLLFDPSNAAYQVGAGGNDVLGRLNWIVLGSLPLMNTHARGPRGVQIGFAFRGFAWAPSMHLFSSLTRPSVQRFEPIQDWDRERKGGELALTREWFPSRYQGHLMFSAAQEQVTFLASTEFHRNRTVTGLDLSQNASWNRHRIYLRTQSRLVAQSGRTEHQRWTLSKGHFSALADCYGMQIGFHYSAGRLSGNPTEADLFTLGGQATGLLPRSLEANVIFQPALPTHSALGDRFERWRANLNGRIWVEGTRVWNAQISAPAYTRVVGLDLLQSIEHMAPSIQEALQRYLGRMESQVTLQRPLDGPMKHRTVFTLGFIHRF